MNNWITNIRMDWQRRPWWMNLVFYFCAYMTVIYMPFDMFLKPVAEDEEIWFGFTLTGWWAKATEPLHWLIYGGLAWGFLHMRAWMWPWAAVYAAQVAIAMLVFNLVDPRGGGWIAGLIAGAIFSIPMIALWRAKDIFAAGGKHPESGEDATAATREQAQEGTTERAD